jgi:hypothetical protein
LTANSADIFDAYAVNFDVPGDVHAWAKRQNALPVRCVSSER